MKKNLLSVFQIAAVFIGTIVGAGLASGQEITQFFTTFGYPSFMGILLCGILYVPASSMIIDLSIQHNLNSYTELIHLVSPGFLGKVINILTTFFLIGSAGIILAGSGALLHQYFGISNWIGISIMLLLALLAALRNTKGLIEINSLIVPSLTIVIFTIFILYLCFYKNVLNLEHIKTIPYERNFWFCSSLVYTGFNILCCSGVLVPFSTEIRNKKVLICGVILGAFGLTVLSFIINLLLLLNVPYIFKYEIPLLYIANRFGNVIQILLLSIIWLEMFSTEVSNIYSVGKTAQKLLGISYKKSVFLVLALAIPISQIGFSNLIKVLFPVFGIVSIFFMLQCSFFYYKQK